MPLSLHSRCFSYACSTLAQEVLRRSAKCCGFLLQCQLYFAAYLGMSNHEKFTHFMNFVMDQALTWATAVWPGEEQTVLYEEQVFDHAPKGKEVNECVMAIRQGQWRATEYALEFCTVAAESG